MVNEEIARLFERMARVLAFKGRDRFRIMAYERAAVSIRDLDEDLASIAAAGKLEEIPGIGEDLSKMIEEYIRKGVITRYERECRGIQPELIELMSIPGLGPRTLALLHQKAQVNDFESLKRCLDRASLLTLKGFGARRIENIKRGIDLWNSSRHRMLIGVAWPLAEKLLEQIRQNELVDRAEAAGSLRRCREDIGDIDILIVSKNGPKALRQLTKMPFVRRILETGETKSAIIVDGGIHVDIRAVDASCFGAAMQYFTGSKQHNIHLRKIAHERGLKCNEYGLFRGDRRIGGENEDDIYDALGMRAMPPELREDRGEIEAAIADKLPRLINIADLCGDLHTHTTWSDGRSTVEEMVNHAEQLGYEYIALTDHSPSERVAHGLDRARLEKKIEEIEKLRVTRNKRAPHILIGAEVDILDGGRLDYPDDILSRLDIVVGGIHSGFKQSKSHCTGRLLDAIANPALDILAHPTSRLIGSREPLDFDFNVIVRAVVGAGVALEINGSMYRLDLNDVMAKAAQEAGALLAIGSDAHSTAQMDQIRYGVFQARRGWVEARSVLNTWPFPDLSKWLDRTHVARVLKKAV